MTIENRMKYICTFHRLKINEINNMYNKIVDARKYGEVSRVRVDSYFDGMTFTFNVKEKTIEEMCSNGAFIDIYSILNKDEMIDVLNKEWVYNIEEDEEEYEPCREFVYILGALSIGYDKNEDALFWVNSNDVVITLKEGYTEEALRVLRGMHPNAKFKNHLGDEIQCIK